MANWKKMAEAFGRSMMKSRQPNKNTKTIREAYENNLDNYLNDPEAKATAESFYKGQELGRMDKNTVQNDLGLDKWRANRGDIVGRRMNKLENADTDKALQTEFDRGFEEAVARRKGKSGMDRSYLEELGLSPDEIDQIDTDVNRRILINLLKKNRDTGDVLRNFK